MARLIPAKPASTVLEKGTAPAILEWLQSHSLPFYARRSAAEIDAAIEQERESWG